MWKVSPIQSIVVFIFEFVFLYTSINLQRVGRKLAFSFKWKLASSRSRNKTCLVTKLSAPFSTPYVFQMGRGVKSRQQLRRPYLSWGKTFTWASAVWPPLGSFDVSNICCFGQKGISLLVYMKNRLQSGLLNGVKNLSWWGKPFKIPLAKVLGCHDPCLRPYYKVILLRTLLCASQTSCHDCHK